MLSTRAVFISLLVVFISACAHQGPNYASGSIAGQIVAENMDSDIAKSALSSTHGEYSDPRINEIFKTLDIVDTPSPEQLQSLVELGSTDFASIIYARSLLNKSDNSYWQEQSLKLSRNLKNDQTFADIRDNFSNYHVLLVPGWNWQTRTDTGADLKFQKKVLASYGLTSSLIRTQEHGDVETNANIIAKAIKQSSELDKSVILISVSKGGADTAYALGNVLNIKDAPHLAGWLNIGGIIAGSTLVDLEMRDPEQWLQSIGFAKDTPLTAVRSLQKNISAERNAKLNYPANITIVNYVALPFASSLSKQSRYSYTRLAQYGPNDGAALTYEMLVPEKPTVLQIGIDHFMRSFDAMNRAIALLYMISESQSNKND